VTLNFALFLEVLSHMVAIRKLLISLLSR